MEAPVENSREKRRTGATTNFTWLIGERIYRLGLSLTVLALVARYLGPEAYGELSFAVNLVLLFATMASAGFEGLVIRLLIREPTRTDAVLGTACLLRVAGGAAMAVPLAAAAFAFPSVAAIRPLVAAVGLILFIQAFDVLDLWFQRHLRSKLAVIGKTTALTLGCALKAVLILREAPVLAFAWATTADFVLNGAALLWLHHRAGGRLAAWRFAPDLAAGLVRGAWPLVVAAGLGSLAFRLEHYLAASQLPAELGGCYLLALRVTEFWLSLGLALTTTLFPLLPQRQGAATPAEYVAWHNAFTATAALGFALALAATLVMPWLTVVLFGAEFRAAAPIIVLKAWTLPLYFTGTVRSHYLLLVDNNRLQAALAAVSCVLTGAVAWLALAHGGATGLALGILASALLNGPILSLVLPGLRRCAVAHWAGLFDWWRPERLRAAAAQFL